MRLSSHGITDVGMVRFHNEDYFDTDDRTQLYIVADGMGGHTHGEVAARMAVESMRAFIAQAAGRERTRQNGHSPHCDWLQRSIQVAHEKVQAAIRRDTALLGMGSTVVSAMLRDETLAVAHVGDSRAYRRRAGRLELLTQDHSWVHAQVAAGTLSEEEAKTHPLRSLVTRVVGGIDGDPLEVDLREVEVQHGDLYLLCSDGLTAMLSDREIDERLAASTGLAEIARLLVYDTNRRGGEDNVTVVVLRVEEDG